METKYINAMKKVYANLLADNGDYDRSKEVATQDVYSPIMKVRPAHTDAEPDPKDFNEMMSEIMYDLTILKVEYASMGYAFKDLMLSTEERLKAVRKTVRLEKERQQDINILCNRYSEFGSVINLTAQDFTGDFTEVEGTFSAMVVEQDEIKYSIASVTGNGYEGNKYVYKNDAFLEDTISTASRKNINDGNSIPYYEYSRITANNTEKETFPLVNFDSIEAKCTITIIAEEKISSLSINSPSPDIVLSGIFISDDGVQFRPVIEQSLELNNTDKKYEIVNYTPGSGLICFPPAMYIQVVLESSSTTDDEIAFYKTEIEG